MVLTQLVTGIATGRGNTSCCEPSEWGSNGVKIGSHPSKSQLLEVPLERPVQWEWGKTRLLSVKSWKEEGTQLLSAGALKRPAQREGVRVLREPEKWWHLVHLLCISERCWEMPRDKEN